jgi:hypothetical protein
MKIKKLSLCLAAMAAGMQLCAQNAKVGINTGNPQGIFHIDGQKDNNTVTPYNNNDLLFRLNNNGEANLVVGGTSLSTAGSASLELNDPNKAILLNRVALDTETGNPFTSASSREGMMVYNTNIPGIFLNAGGSWQQWIKIVDVAATTGNSNIMDIGYKANENGVPNSTTAQPPSDNSANVAQYTGGAISNVTPTTCTDGDPNTNTVLIPLRNAKADKNAEAEGTPDISIPENGRYVFAFRLYGAVNINGNNTAQTTSVNSAYGNFHIYIINNTTGGKLLNEKEIVMVRTGNTNARWTTYSFTMVTPLVKKGDKISIRVGQDQMSKARLALVAMPKGYDITCNRTSFTYWKLK